MLAGIKGKEFHFGATFLGKVFINSTRGAAPNPNPILGPIYDCISWASYTFYSVSSGLAANIWLLLQIAMPIWRRGCDSQIIKHKEEHREYLTRIGLTERSAKKTD